MSLPFDPGDASLVLQVAVFFLLILGLPFVKGIGTKKNFIIHGYLTVFALILHIIGTLIVMIPSFGSGFAGLSEISFFSSFIFWPHVILGTVAPILGFIVVGFWVSKPLSNMACLKMKKMMMPLLIIWAISLIFGALVHILGIV
jgi:hypothetical protein